ncbi:MAG: TIM barrel protein [Bacteroidia bacterium]|nr:TIM barrel protein [Bacteroidia bacterium]
MALNSLESFAKPVLRSIPEPNYSLLLLATNWGFDGSWEEFATKVKAAGYDGVEVWFPGEEKNRNEFFAAMQKHNLQYGFLVAGSDKDPSKHAEQFKLSLRAAVKVKPLYINCHSGKDFFTYEDNKKIIDFSYEVANESSVPVYHETHRGRMLYSTPITCNFIESTPALRLTLDISHWCNVHESLLADQQEAVALALSRTDHIHARIGHAEGPQVNDPRAPEWDDAVKAHFGWWDMVVAQKRKEGQRLTILTEFGPANYMLTLPYTRQPVADQWAINVHMMEVCRKRYGN